MQCTKCQLDKEAEDFYENLRHVSGLTGICKSCTYNKTSDKDKIKKPTMTQQEAAEAFEKLDVNSDTYFQDKAVLIGIMN